MSETMQAVRIHEFGSPDVMVVEEVLVPEPGPDEVLLKAETCFVGA